jgi:hypothetical protein
LLLLAALPLQFLYFYRDYLTDYRIRAAEWFDPSNFPAIADDVVALDRSAPVVAVFVSDAMDDGVVHWRFQLEKRHREDLWRRTTFFAHDRFDAGSVPGGGLMIFYATDPEALKLAQDPACCTVARNILHVTGAKSAVVLRKAMTGGTVPHASMGPVNSGPPAAR